MGFKTGDKVMVICDTPLEGWGEVDKGDVGVVRNVFSNGDIEVDFPTQERWATTAEELELIERRAASGKRN